MDLYVVVLRPLMPNLSLPPGVKSATKRSLAKNQTESLISLNSCIRDSDCKKLISAKVEGLKVIF